MTYLDGVDVSAHQATTPALAGVEFLFARATYGTSSDVRYAAHIGRARAAGLATGAYHFGRTGNVSAQVAAFLAAAGSVDWYALDLESDGANPAMTRAEAVAFVLGVHATGRRIGLYHSESGFPAVGQDWNWVANWSATPKIPWTFWQHRGSPLDLDRFKGTSAELHRTTGSPHYGATVTRPTALWNPATKRWVYNGPNAIKVGTPLIVRGARYSMGGQITHPVVSPFGGYYVPVANVKLGPIRHER